MLRMEVAGEARKVKYAREEVEEREGLTYVFRSAYYAHLCSGRSQTACARSAAMSVRGSECAGDVRSLWRRMYGPYTRAKGWAARALLVLAAATC